MQQAVKQVRAGEGPFFIEALTYRFMGHSMADPSHGHYRTRDEVDEHRKRDPLLLLKERMLTHSLAQEEDFKQLEREIADEVAAAVRFAEQSPFPDPSELYEDVTV
jgi:pyruvate dehydrogenase E1 component alpha subunit